MPDSAMILPANPKANYLAHQPEIDEAIRRVMESGSYILGKDVEAFEQEFARFVGVRHAIGVGSGTEAIHLALRVLGIGSGDGVLTVSHTAVATVAAIELAGAVPVLVDTDPVSHTMDIASLEAAIAATTCCRLKAIVPVHLYGHPANMPAIMKIARRHELLVVEDCAQSHGATISGRSTGSWGHMAAFSFYPTKNLGALGDGGATVTDDTVLAGKARLLRQYGWRTRYISDVAGMNTRLDELQAAILRVKLHHLAAENARRREIAAIYDASFQSTDIVRPQCLGDVYHVYHQYAILSPYRDELAEHLRDNGIGTAVLYPEPVHLQPAYRGRVALAPHGLLTSERTCRQVLCLPMHAQLEARSAEQVARQTVGWHEARRVKGA